MDKYGPSSFVPQPKIDSSLLILEPIQMSEDERQKRLVALKYISALFNQRSAPSQEGICMFRWYRNQTPQARDAAGNLHCA